MPVNFTPWRYLIHISGGDNEWRHQSLRDCQPCRDRLQDLGISEIGVIKARSINDTAFASVQLESQWVDFGGARFKVVSYFSLLAIRSENVIDELPEILGTDSARKMRY